MAGSPIVLVTAGVDASGLQAHPVFGTDLLVFAESEALAALNAITEHRPRLVVLAEAFVQTPRGAALINRVQSDPSLSDAEIRVVSDASDYPHLVARHAEPGLAQTALPGQPLAPDYRGTRRVPRFTVGPGVAVQLDRTPDDARRPLRERRAGRGAKTAPTR